MATNAESADNGATTESIDNKTEVTRAANSVALPELRDGNVPATHRHDLRSLIHHLNTRNFGTEPNITRMFVYGGDCTTLHVHYDDGVITPWDVEYATGRDYDNFTFQAWSDHVQIRLYD
jgi:hypothetical protein